MLCTEKSRIHTCELICGKSTSKLDSHYAQAFFAEYFHLFRYELEWT